jgi:hypothetical protein
MRPETKVGLRSATGTALATLAFAALLVPGSLGAQESSYHDVTFTHDIAPILQRSCQTCHRESGVALMTLVTYQQVRRYSSRIVYRTGLRDVAGAMPPWYVEKDIGIQHFKNDPPLNDLEVAQIAAWVENGMPEGDPVEIKEVNDVDNRSREDGRQTVGRRYVFHHMIWSTRVLDEDQDTGQFAERGEDAVGWPVHEVGRNPDMFAPEAGRLLRAGSSVVSNSIHLHSNGVDTRAHVEIGFRFHPKGYEPQYRRAGLGLGNGVDIDIRGNEKDQELHAYRTLNQHTKIVTFEPHLHAPGARMCLEAIWGYNVETLSCVGYDHNWVRGYAYADDAAPLLPKGTILHIVGYMDTTEDNIDIADPRNWQGAGNRSVITLLN